MGPPSMTSNLNTSLCLDILMEKPLSVPLFSANFQRSSRTGFSLSCRPPFTLLIRLLYKARKHLDRIRGSEREAISSYLCVNLIA